MIQNNKLSSRVYTIIRAAVAAAALPIIFIYIFIAKPDYKIMNMAAHVVLPVAGAVGDLVTWPVRATKKLVVNIHDISTLRSENEELRVRLADALANQDTCDIAILENQKLYRELDIVRQQPRDTLVANVIQNNSAMHNRTFTIDRGVNSGIERGMIVTTTDGRMAGVVSDVGGNFARVRALTDADSNIAVRIVGTDVYGFLSGDGTRYPKLGFFSDPEFQPTPGIKLVTSNISGVLPNGIVVGNIIDDTDVSVVGPGELSRVMILKFDGADKYK